MSVSPEEAYLRLRDLFHQLRITPPRDPKVAARARELFLAKVDAIGASKPNYFPLLTARVNMLKKPRRFAWAVASILLAVSLLLGGTGAAYASQSALPAEPLYPLKIAIEDLRLALSTDEAGDANLLLQFIQRRVDEMTSLAVQERFEEISIPVARYNDSLLQLATIILGYIERGDSRSQELISLLAEALAEHEKVLSALLETVPASANSDIELAIQISKKVSQSEDITPGQVGGEVSDGDVEIKDIQPDKGLQGQTLNVEIAGENTHFSAASVVNFIPADGIDVNSVVANNSTSITVNLTIEDSASLGDRQVVVITQQEIASSESFRIEEQQFEDSQEESEESNDELDDIELIGVDPDAGQQGQTLTIVIVGEGTHFNSNSHISLGPGIAINSISAQTGMQLTVSVTIASNASLGDRSVSVTTGSEVAGGQEFRVESGAADESGDEGERNDESDGGEQDSDQEEAQEVTFTGTVESITSQTWTISSKHVAITAQTEIKDDIEVGDVVEVRALLMPDGTLVAERIELND
ncbi:MAG: DUF5666 domain-containing protein [Chloroflexi bacterium]|nr:DUF5666 domain-containing protein [Chloroflexota bacterium]